MYFELALILFLELYSKLKFKLDSIAHKCYQTIFPELGGEKTIIYI